MRRLKGYYHSGETTISTEGLMDGLKKIAGMLSSDAKATDPTDQKLGEGWSGRWGFVKKWQVEFAKTYGDARWVEKHLNSRTVDAPKLAKKLSFKGKVFTSPTDAVDILEGIVLPFFKRAEPQMIRYDNDIEKIQTLYKTMADENGDVDAAAVAKLLAAARQIKAPDIQLPPETPGGNILNRSKKSYEASNKAVDSQVLKALTAEEIVAGAKAVMASLDRYFANRKKLFWYPGLDAGEGLLEGLDYDDDNADELYTILYFQQDPQENTYQTEFIDDVWFDTLYDICVWLYSQVSESVMTLESIDGGVLMYSTEGIFDTLKKIIIGKKEGILSHDPNDPMVKKQKIRSSQYANVFAKEIKQTLANPTWVEKHFNGGHVNNDRLAAMLAISGTVQEPAAVISAAIDICEAFIKEHQGGMDAYIKSIDEVGNYGKSIMSLDDAEFIKKLEEKCKIVKLPFPEGFKGPVFVGGQQLIGESTESKRASLSPPAKYPNGVKLPELSVDDIVKGAMAVSDAVSRIYSFWDERWDDAQLPGLTDADGPLAKLAEIEGDNDVESFSWWVLHYDATPADQMRALFSYVNATMELLHTVCKWLYAACGQRISMEGIDRGRFSDYFKTPVNPAYKDPTVGLFGTVESKWRDTLIPLLKVKYFNPVVEEWTEQAQAQEELIKRTASGIAFVITPKQKGFFSFVELTDIALTSPERLFVTVLDEDDGEKWAEDAKKSIDAVVGYLEGRGATVHRSLEALAEAINADIAPISKNGDLAK